MSKDGDSKKGTDELDDLEIDLGDMTGDVVEVKASPEEKKEEDDDGKIPSEKKPCPNHNPSVSGFKNAVFDHQNRGSDIFITLNSESVTIEDVTPEDFCIWISQITHMKIEDLDVKFYADVEKRRELIDIVDKQSCERLARELRSRRAPAKKWSSWPIH